MTYWILPKSAIPISCDSVQRATIAELNTTETKDEMTEFTRRVNARLQALTRAMNIGPEVPAHRIFELENEDQEFIDDFNRLIDDLKLHHVDKKSEQCQSMSYKAYFCTWFRFLARKP